MQKIFVCLPCYNEEDNIGLLVDEWQDVRENIQDLGYNMSIVLIDDKSTDGTLEVMKTSNDKYDNITILQHETNQNLGGGVKTAFEYFLKNGESGDVCVLMDGDNTHAPSYSVPMLKRMKDGYDCVIASRYCGDSNVIGVPKIRLFLSDGARLFYTLILGVKGVKDYTCGYRAYTYDIIEKATAKYGERLIEMKTFACMMEVLYKLYLCNGKFTEVGFELRYDNKKGESKMKIIKTIKDSIGTALKLRFSGK